MTGSRNRNPNGRPVAVIVGATSKWQADGRNTVFAHGNSMKDDEVPVGARWGLGGALAQRFAREGYFVVLTTRSIDNAAGISEAIREMGGECWAVELDVGVEASVHEAFAVIREQVGHPDVLIYNAGYMAGRELPPEHELLEFFPADLFEIAVSVACRGPFWTAKEVLPSMRERGHGSVLFSNNAYSLRGRKRRTGESLYYPRTMMRALAQSLTEEYSGLGVHVANVVIDGFIDSPGTRALPQFVENPALLINPVSIAEAFYYLHTQEPSCYTHELQLTPAVSAPSY